MSDEPNARIRLGEQKRLESSAESSLFSLHLAKVSDVASISCCTTVEWLCCVTGVRRVVLLCGLAKTQSGSLL